MRRLAKNDIYTIEERNQVRVEFIAFIVLAKAYVNYLSLIYVINIILIFFVGHLYVTW